MREAKWWASDFGGWAAEYGVRRLASELRLTEPAIYQWLRGRTTPRPPASASDRRAERRVA
jgi:hypothetical protein